MPPQEVLVLAMTKMLSGICTAGFTLEPDPVTGLRWVRPVREFDSLLVGDMTDADGRLVQCGDVVELALIAPRPDPPHVEDWLVDFVHHRPRLLRRLEGEKRARFFPRYLDRAPEEVLISFVLAGDANHPRATSRRGISVTDLKWRALGRAWLGEKGGYLTLEQDTLLERLNADALYLALGLSRNWQGEYWPLVVGVHVVPDYEGAIDLDRL
jgi:hypothetical protein